MQARFFWSVCICICVKMGDITPKKEAKKKQKSICIIGAGFAGMCAAIRLKTKLGLDNFTIFDDNVDFGGTWLIHSYPKCGCDVPAHLYSFSFEPNPNWSQVFCSQAEILAYLQKTARKHDLYSRARFCHQVQKLTWVTKLKKWIVVTLNLDTGTISEDMFDIVISGHGPLRNPSVPEIFQNFKGPLIHSAKWDHSICLKNKVVAVVGSGASAIQIIPGIVKDVKNLYSFQRRPTWITFKAQFKLSPMIQSIFDKVPIIRKAFRSYIFLLYEGIYLGIQQDSIFQSFGEWACNFQMQKQIPNNPELIAKLQPPHRFGCKRPQGSNTYYRAVAQNHVEVIRENVENVLDDAIVTEDGKKRPIDIIICATGYKQSAEAALYPARIFIKNDLQDEEKEITNFLREDAQFYFGIISSPFPNLFLILGPNSGVLYNSVIFAMECQVHWILQVLRKMMNEEDCKIVTVKESAQQEYNRKLQIGLKKLALGGGSLDCNAWFVDRKTKINNVSLDCSLTKFYKKTRHVKFRDLDFN